METVENKMFKVEMNVKNRMMLEAKSISFRSSLSRKACGVKGQSPLPAEHHTTRKKAQEGRKNSPVDCFSVGNPRRGFPCAKHLIPEIYIRN